MDQEDTHRRNCAQRAVGFDKVLRLAFGAHRFRGIEEEYLAAKFLPRQWSGQACGFAPIAGRSPTRQELGGPRSKRDPIAL